MKKKLGFSYLFMLAVCIVFLLSGIFIINSMMQRNRGDNVRYLYEAASQEKKTIASQISGKWETLMGVSKCISSTSIRDDGDLIPALKEINMDNSFLYMGVVEENGTGQLVDLDGGVHEVKSMDQETFFQRAMKGEQSLSVPRENPLGSGSLIFYGVPLVSGGRTSAVLCAAEPAGDIQQVLDDSLIKGSGSSEIVDGKGNRIFRSDNADEKILLELEGISKEQREKIRSDFGAGYQDFIDYKINGRHQWAVYTPLGVNGWFLVSMVPEKVVNSNYHIILGVIFIIGFALLIFIFFVYRFNSLADKNKKELERLAYTDQLTGCANFASFLINAGKLLQDSPGRSYAIWYCDIRKFKLFNDLFGFEAGDQVLTSLAGMISETLPEGQLFCRVSADNFVGLRFYEKKEELFSWFRHLSERMEHYEPAEKQEYPLELSAGIYWAGQEAEPLSLNDMIDRANMAQKTVKHSSGQQIASYSDEIRRKAHHEAELEAHMNQALADGEFLVYFQPKIRIQKGNEVAGAEALVRWNHREKGLIGPADFVPLFERNGSIIQIDRYMFEQVCKWLSAEGAEERRRLRISVNVSRLGLYQEDFLEYYIGVKERYGIDDGVLELEFTESVLLEDEALFRSIIIELRKNGFVCSLDDFGSGYSSLNVLKELPIQVLKLDMLFFRHGTNVERARIIVGHIIQMAKQLGIGTVAEGVEELEQVGMLRRMGCDLVQGYAFSKPMPIAEFERFLLNFGSGIEDPK